MKVLEVCRYIAPAYAGMVLAEQGVQVDKWVMTDEPILTLKHGEQLWEWINHGKNLSPIAGRKIEDARGYDAILTNLRPVNVNDVAQKTRAAVIKLTPVGCDRSFDVVAQMQAWGDFAPWVPFYLGDTVAGLWMAFKAMTAKPGMGCEIQHPAALSKLVELELSPLNDRRLSTEVPWESTEHYAVQNGQAVVNYNGEIITEKARNSAWRWQNLRHANGRILI